MTKTLIENKETVMAGSVQEYLNLVKMAKENRHLHFEGYYSKGNIFGYLFTSDFGTGVAYLLENK